MSGVSDHHQYCGWHWDQYDSECTCGATRPKAVWFDAYVRECDEAREEAGIKEGAEQGRSRE
jgi:hypothetical protein